MKQKIVGILVVFVLVGSMLAGIRWVIRGGWPSSGAVGETLPPQIQFVVPADGERVEETYGFCVHFDFEAGRGMADEPEQSMRFTLDGVNVTRDVVDVVQLEYGYPSPLGEPCYRRSESLHAGWHTVRVTYQDVSGERFSYKWRFEILSEE